MCFSRSVVEPTARSKNIADMHTENTNDGSYNSDEMSVSVPTQVIKINDISRVGKCG